MQSVSIARPADPTFDQLAEPPVGAPIVYVFDANVPSCHGVFVVMRHDGVGFVGLRWRLVRRGEFSTPEAFAFRPNAVPAIGPDLRCRVLRERYTGRAALGAIVRREIAEAVDYPDAA